VYAGSRDAARGERAVGEIGGDARLLVLDVTLAPGLRRTDLNAAAAARGSAKNVLYGVEAEGWP
jgi:hypothetical protein